MARNEGAVYKEDLRNWLTGPIADARDFVRMPERVFSGWPYT
jgi:hypothetical protein